MTHEFESVMQTALIVFAVVYIIILLAALAVYIMRSIALTHIGKRRNIKAPWLIWIPVANAWALGALADEYDNRNGLKRHFRVILLVLSILISGGFIALIGNMIGSVFELEALSSVSFVHEYEIMGEALELFVDIYSCVIIIALASTVYSALLYICLYKLFESLDSSHCVLFFVLSIFIPVFEAICLLCLRNSGHPCADETAALPEPEFHEKGWYEA